MTRLISSGKVSTLARANEARCVHVADVDEHGADGEQIVVTFSEKRPKKSWFQVYMGEEDVPWEQWCVPLTFFDEPTLSASSGSLTPKSGSLRIEVRRDYLSLKPLT